jgi:hypothetical protein
VKEKEMSWHKVFGAVIVVLLFAVTPTSAQVQWPPFEFELTPAYDNGKIIYTIKLYKRTDGILNDIVFKIPLPEGTRFLEARAQSTTSHGFDGREITFFTATLHKPISNASFVVEVIEPAQTTFTTYAWIAWKGNPAGDFLTETVTLNLNQQLLNWEKPRSRLRLEAKASVEDNIIHYIFYPKKLTNRRMWDLVVNVPIPAGTTLVSAEAPSPFVTSFDGKEVSFSVLEMDRWRDTSPLLMTISVDDFRRDQVTTHAWATWKNVGRSVGRHVVFKEETRSGDIIVQPWLDQQVVSDIIGDTPFVSYDITSIAVTEVASALQFSFYTAADVGPTGEPLEYIIYIDNDCNFETGAKRGNRGVEHWIRYTHEREAAYVYNWNEAESKWANRRLIEFSSPNDGMINVRVPNEYLHIDQQFCWLGRVWNKDTNHSPNPPNEWVGADKRLTQYQLVRQ